MSVVVSPDISKIIDPSVGKVLEIVPGKTDVELAEEFKRRLVEVHEPIIKLLDEMKQRGGFEASIGLGLGPLGKYVILNLQVYKKF